MSDTELPPAPPPRCEEPEPRDQPEEDREPAERGAAERVVAGDDAPVGEAGALVPLFGGEAVAWSTGRAEN